MELREIKMGFGTWEGDLNRRVDNGMGLGYGFEAQIGIPNVLICGQGNPGLQT